MNIFQENKMWKVLLPLSISILLLVAAFSLLFYLNNISNNENPKPVLSFSATGEVTTINDIARLSFTFSQLDEELNIAREIVTDKVNEAYELLDDFGVDEEDIKTTSYSVNPEYDYIYERRGVLKERKLKGYRITHETSIKIKDIDSAGDIVGGITEIEPENVGNLYFSLEDEERKQFEDEAIILAINNAKAKAKKIAKESDIRLGKIVSISFDRPVYAQTQKLFSAQVESDSVAPARQIPIEQGENKITRTANITYEVKYGLFE